jgi:hypothetical protein
MPIGVFGAGLADRFAAVKTQRSVTGGRWKRKKGTREQQLRYSDQ